MDEYKSGWAARAASEPDDEIIRSGQLFEVLLWAETLNTFESYQFKSFKVFKPFCTCFVPSSTAKNIFFCFSIMSRDVSPYSRHCRKK